MSSTDANRPAPDKPATYRDTVATIGNRGKRIWVYPTRPKGKLHSIRKLVAVVLLAFLFGGPFIRIGDKPMLLFDILNRKFIIFGGVFWPQDFHLFVLSLLTLVVFVILFTLIFGRLFCGWVCPQTIFLEMVFRKIEYFIEGNAPQQRALDRAPWSMNKIFKKGLKHSIFFGLSFLIANTFLAYIVGSEELLKIITEPPSLHTTGLTAITIFSIAFYGVFAWFREQACTMVCPYGRLQGVLLDRNSVAVAYDYKRGEPRGPAADSQAGDCIDCNACVKVCPTGIDIRNGTQLECVHCTACIDRCNRVMAQLNRPSGLIRYSSAAAIEAGEKLSLANPRTFLFSGALIVLIGLVSVLLLNRTDVETTILRASGSLYEETSEGTVRNLYTVRLVNKTFDDLPVVLKLESPEGKISMVAGDLTVAGQSLSESAFFVELPGNRLYSSSIGLVIGVYSGDRLLEEIRTTFLGPRKTWKQ